MGRLCSGKIQRQWYLKYEKNLFIITYAHFKFHCENLVSPFVIRYQIQYDSQDLHPKHHSGNANIVKYHITWMSIPMKLQWVKITEYPTTQGDYLEILQWPAY